MTQQARLNNKILMAVSIAAILWINSSAASANPTTENADLRKTAIAAARAIAQGDFEGASCQIEKITAEDPTDEPLFNNVLELKNRYQELKNKLQKKYQKTYDEKCKKIKTAAEDIEYLQWLLQASEKYDGDTKFKKEYEESLVKKIDDKWLSSLIQLQESVGLVKRVRLEQTLEAKLKEKIITECQQIAEKLEQQNKLLEAYGKVYSFLAAMEKQDEPQNEEKERWSIYGSKDHQEHSRQLLYKVGLNSLYAPDPNTEGISWQERREGITFRMIHTALSVLAGSYVKEPDFKEITLKAMENCLLLAEADKIAETFEKLQETQLVETYSNRIQNLKNNVQELESELFTYAQPLLVLDKVMEINRQTIELPDEVVMSEFMDGLFSALDGYTYIIWPGDVRGFRKDMTGEFSGIGIHIGKVDGLLKATSLLEDQPAMRAGLDADDTIVAVDGKSTTNMTLDMAVRCITGPAGTDVVLTIDRKGFDQPKDFKITREKIVVQTVKGLYRNEQGQWQYFADPNSGIGYVRLTNFAGETTDSLRVLLKQLKKQGAKALILDLRNNSGGYLSGAIEVADTFLSDGVIVSTRPRTPGIGHYDYATKETFDDKMPLVVLINSISASASEIVSGALKDHDRALIVGTRSFGKGSVQQIQNLQDDAQMKITVAYYYLPSGRRVHRDTKDKTNEDYGVEPDLTVELTRGQFRKFSKTRYDAGILHRNDSPENGKKWTVYQLDNMLSSDPQLQMALMCLNADLLAKEHSSDDRQEQNVEEVLVSVPAEND